MVYGVWHEKNSCFFSFFNFILVFLSFSDRILIDSDLMEVGSWNIRSFGVSTTFQGPRLRQSEYYHVKLRQVKFSSVQLEYSNIHIH